MGKDKKGRKLPVGVYQRSDGRFYARLTLKSGKRIGKYFHNPQDAKNWRADIQYLDSHGLPLPGKEKVEEGDSGSDSTVSKVNSSMDVDDWFDYWVSHIKKDIADSSRSNYKSLYKNHIKPVVGNIRLCDLKPLHCNAVLEAKLEAGYKGQTIANIRGLMVSFFKSALDNGLLTTYPMQGVICKIPCREKNDIKVLSRTEQAAFLRAVEGTYNYPIYALVLETGLRTTEVMGLTWDNIDWSNRTICIRKTLTYSYEESKWAAGPPKSKTSYRIIPLTDKAYHILHTLYDTRGARKEAPELNLTMTYTDLRSGNLAAFNMEDLVFVSPFSGLPSHNSSYGAHLNRMCKKAGIRHVTMHMLRHTFATRMIEAGVAPYVLQKLLGHTSIQTTMNIYVHATTDALTEAVTRFQTTYSDAI